MKIIRIGKHGIEVPKPQIIEGKQGKYLAFLHGEAGRGRWEYRLPLAAREFPPPQEENTEILFDADGEFRLIPLGKKDNLGNDLYLLARAERGKADGTYLVFWCLSPGFRGSASYEVSGNAKVIARGIEAQGLAGRMGSADCPVVLVEGPCVLRWTRYGRLYGSPKDWVAVFDGEKWNVSPYEECILEEAVFNY